jgi:hypothetical protein
MSQVCSPSVPRETIALEPVFGGADGTAREVQLRVVPVQYVLPARLYGKATPGGQKAPGSQPWRVITTSAASREDGLHIRTPA